MPKTKTFSTFLFAVTGMLGAVGSTHSEASRSDTAYFKERMVMYFQAWSKTDSQFTVEPAARLYSDTSDLFIWDIFPPLSGYTGLARYKTEIIRNAYSRFDRFRLTGGGDLRVTRRGAVAWTTTTFHAVGRFKDGKPINLGGRLTDIWERTPQGWRIIHEHSSVPLTPRFSQAAEKSEHAVAAQRALRVLLQKDMPK